VQHYNGTLLLTEFCNCYGQLAVVELHRVRHLLRHTAERFWSHPELEHGSTSADTSAMDVSSAVNCYPSHPTQGII
jgi:hypothetical protein